MEKIDLINIYVKTLLTSYYVFLIYEKIVNSRSEHSNYIIVLITCNLISATYIVLRKYLSSFISIAILYVIYGIFIDKMKKEKFNFIAYIISCVISYIIYWISVIIVGTVSFIFYNKIKFTSPIILLLILLVNSAFILGIFKIKRLKNGFNFLNNTNASYNTKTVAAFLFGITIIIFAIPQGSNSVAFKMSMVAGTILVFISLSYWIKSQITKTYKSKMRDRTIEIQKTEIDEKNKILEEVKEENLNFATTIHKYNKKISALEFIIKNRLEQETNTEFANELAIILKETKETAENFAKETEIKTNKIPETNVPGIDTMLKYMQEEAKNKNINFDVKLNTSINSLLENTISKDKFETLIGDHVKDAIIAVDASKNSYKSILVTLGLVEGMYEFSVYDTGIEFEIETLLKLGEEQITTHKETGGSGIGFMSTFETLKECKASLIIEEYNPETTSYTKCITIRFDGKNKYKIYSYRANKIKEQKYKRKITIEELK